ncbi:hypothetical protein G6F22_012329 [Rhizopus arrhizus]|nr:hypothetical protein G6F22_012329 [Rhizopus arrhizus]
MAWWCSGLNGWPLQALAQRVRIIAGGLEAGIQAVEYRQQLAQQLLVGELAGLLDVTGDALALVLQVGALTQRIGPDLFNFGAQALQFVVDAGGGGRIGGGLLGFDIWMFVVHVWVPGGQSPPPPTLVWAGCCVSSVGCPRRATGRRKGRAQHISGGLDQRDHAVIGHALGPDHAQHAQHLAVGGIGGRDQRNALQRHHSGFLADEDAHARGLDGPLQQLQDLALAGEQLEQLAQALQVGQVLHAHQPGLAGHQHVVGRWLQGLLSQLDAVRQQLLQFGTGVAQLQQQAGADLGHRQPGEMGVEVVGDLLQLPRRELLAGLDDPVLYLVVGEHQDRQHPAPVQRHEIDLAEGELLAPWRADHADEVAHRRQQLRGAAQQGLGAAAAGQLLAQAGQFALPRRLHLPQAVDEHPVAMRGRNAPGRGMRRGQQPQVLQVTEDVADGGRADLQAGHTRQRLRADRLAVLDITRDQRAQQMARTRGKLVGRTVHGINL